MIEGLEVYEGKRFYDNRGYFIQTWDCDSIPHEFKQDNVSFSYFGVLRGLHFQKEPFTQGKLVSVIKGSVWDVAVDIRKDSSTFGEWFGIALSELNNTRMYIPEGFAHGFIVTSSDGAIFHYKCTEVYHPESEGSLVWDDPLVSIAWPLKPIHIAEKDAGAKTLDQL